MNIEKRLKEIEDRKEEIRKMLDGDEEVDLDALEQELDSLNAEEKELRSKQEVAQKINEGATVRKIKEMGVEQVSYEDVRSTEEYRSAFMKRLLGLKLNEKEQRAYTLVPNTAGAVVPTSVAQKIFERMVKTAPLLGEITLFRVPGNLKIAIEGNRVPATRHEEASLINPAGDTLDFVTLSGYEYAKVVRVSKTISNMAIDAFESWLVNAMAEDIARAIEADLINGTGTNMPRGVEFATTWQPGNYIGLNVSAQPPEVLDYATLLQFLSMLPAGYSSSAVILTHPRFLYTDILNITDYQGYPLLVRDPEAGFGFRLFGFRVITSDYVEGSRMYLFDPKQIIGNLSQDIIVESSVESGFLYNSIDFRATAIFDANVASRDAFVKLELVSQPPQG